MNHKHRKLFSAGEWDWFLKMGSSYTDAEQKKAFYETVIEKKQADANYSLYSDFPRNHGLEICAEIIQMLKHGKTEPTEVPMQESEYQKLLGELISDGRHLKSEESA